jgi:hypothetical protein
MTDTITVPSIIERRNSLLDLPREIQLERIISRREAATLWGISLRELGNREAKGLTPKRYPRGEKAQGYKVKDVIAE